jgi:16S rRNA (guanine(966)-N(2))-methyltransferase RsmD
VADAGRVIAGAARGTRLAAPGPGTRPFGDRVKETLFAILEPDLPGARVLDLFAGSGAAGIEGLSRGADAAVFVERDGAAVRTIEANLRAARLGDRARVVRADAVAWLSAPRPPGPFDVVVLDPPYADAAALEAALRRLGSPGDLLAPGGRVVAKHFWRSGPPARLGLLRSERSRRFGETALTFYRRAPDAAGADDALPDADEA